MLVQISIETEGVDKVLLLDFLNVEVEKLKRVASSIGATTAPKITAHITFE